VDAVHGSSRLSSVQNSSLRMSSAGANRLEDLLASSPRDVSLHAAAVSSSEIGASLLKNRHDVDKDPVLEGVTQMLQILKQHVNKHSSSKTPLR
jgi:hypothetical protein